MHPSCLGPDKEIWIFRFVSGTIHLTRTTLKQITLLLIFSASAYLRAQPQPGDQLWAFDAGSGASPIQSSPAIGFDGTIYFGALGNLYAITNRGSNAWVFPTSGPDDSSPAVAADGTIYYSSSSGSLYAVKPDGSKKWEYAAQCGSGSPAIGRDNTIYIDGYAFLHDVSSAGTNVWKYGIGTSSTFLSPTITLEDSIFIPAAGDTIVYDLNPNGTQKWSREVRYVSGDSAAIGLDGTIYITAGSLYAFSAAGTNLWANQANFFISSSPAIGKDGTIYVAASGGSLCAITPTGDTKWQVLQSGQGLPGRTPAA